GRAQRTRGLGWWWASVRLGGRTKPPVKAGRPSRDEDLIKLRSKGSMRTWRLIPEGSGGRVRMIGRHSSLKPDWGKPTVRNFRGGAGNVSDGRTKSKHRRLAQRRTR